uniref:NADH-ubiquinone oxidoreductase chain 3 n=1 Tax=Nothopuga sp. 1 LP-2008 TaxID=504482 RepID=A9LI67_9ARAC|nr:NADH dehydrogenase subunit 3 [Nothopuga sp. 1 LP-2008]ABS71896.1 NADH dehydrogenase subunit 3 [Nothopuga sp. 1 LP-2008]
MITSMTIFMLIIISSLSMFITILLSQKTITDQEKLSPFECGFNPATSPRIPFSIRFFLIAMIFLVFDVEIVLLLPIPLIHMNPNITIMSSTLFILILLLGLFHEWNKGALNWAS